MSEITKIPSQNLTIPYMKIQIIPGRNKEQQSSSGNLPAHRFRVSSLTLVWRTYIVITVIPAGRCHLHFVSQRFHIVMV